MDNLRDEQDQRTRFSSLPPSSPPLSPLTVPQTSPERPLAETSQSLVHGTESPTQTETGWPTTPMKRQRRRRKWIPRGPRNRSLSQDDLRGQEAVPFPLDFNSDGLLPSSPIPQHSVEARAAARRRKGQKKRLATLAQRREEAERRQQELSQAQAVRCVQTCKEVLAHLNEDGFTFGDLVLYVSDPENWQGNHRYTGFFSYPARVKTVLDHWISSGNSDAGRQVMEEWVLTRARHMVRREGSAATSDGFLQASKKVVDTSFALDFSFTRVNQQLHDLCPNMMAILEEFATSAKQRRKGTAKLLTRKATVQQTPSSMCSEC